MTTKSKVLLTGLFVLLPAALLGPAAAAAQDAPAPDGGPQGPLATPTILVDIALENRDELELTADQASRLEAFQSASAERTASARDVIAAWRDQLAAERDALADSADLGPKARRRALSSMARPTEEVRDALRTIRQEREATMDELRATLTVDQMDALREVARDEFPGLARRGRDGARGMAPGRGFGPRFGPDFGPRFGPYERGPRRFRR